ncbi:dGTPase [Endozoicomonadaceae bacterium StTr2]
MSQQNSEAMDYRKKITGTRHRLSSVDEIRDVVEETESNRGRVIQSAAVRRLQQKTQVYPLETNAGVRSRLTHSLEVQQTGRYISRTILKQLTETKQLNKLGLEGIESAFINLVEMSCLLHDVGNPPFGHFGEATISRWLQQNARKMHGAAAQNTLPSHLFDDVLLPDLCEFEGNAQGLRIIHSLQDLNLTYSQLAAAMKYTRAPYQPRPAETDTFAYRKKKPGFFYTEEALVKTIWQQLDIAEDCRFPLVYIMEAADDIAYCIADLEDAVDKNILSYQELQQNLRLIWSELSENKSSYLTDMMDDAIRKTELHLTTKRQAQEFIMRLRTRLVRDLVDYAAKRYIDQHEAVFNGTLDEPLIDGNSHQHLALQTLKDVTVRFVFSSPEKETPELRGYSALVGLLEFYRPLLELKRRKLDEIILHDSQYDFLEQRLWHRLPGKYRAAYSLAVEQIDNSYNAQEKTDLEWYYRARLLIDYISGMTDNFVVAEYQGLSGI